MERLDFVKKWIGSLVRRYKAGAKANHFPIFRGWRCPGQERIEDSCLKYKIARGGYFIACFRWRSDRDAYLELQAKEFPSVSLEVCDD
jgi:hypothetical protein